MTWFFGIFISSLLACTAVGIISFTFLTCIWPLLIILTAIFARIMEGHK